MPPTITRTKPPVSLSNGPPPSQGLLAQARPVGEVVEEWFNTIIYGPNRVGKTRLACEWPKPLLLLDLEPMMANGAASVPSTPGIQYIKVTTSKQMMGLVEELKRDTYYQTVVVDSGTSYQDIILQQDILKAAEMPVTLNFGLVTGDQYRERSELIKERLRPILSLRKYVVVNCKERDHNPPKEEKYSSTGKLQPDIRAKFLRGVGQESFFAPNLGGGAADWLMDGCTNIVRLYVDKEVIEKKTKVKVSGQEQERSEWIETGKVIRCLRCTYHPNYAAGMRAKGDVPDVLERPTFEKLLKIIRGS